EGGVAEEGGGGAGGRRGEARLAEHRGFGGVDAVDDVLVQLLRRPRALAREEEGRILGRRRRGRRAGGEREQGGGGASHVRRITERAGLGGPARRRPDQDARRRSRRGRPASRRRARSLGDRRRGARASTR